MSDNVYVGKMEAILFASGEPVLLERIASVLDLKKTKFEAVVGLLDKKYSDINSGIKLLKLGDSLQFVSNPSFVEPVREVMALKRNSPLSSAAMEVLALVSYNQPVTKAFIEQVRGVDCSGVMSSLVQKGLIEECGRLELAGRPLLYGTTKDFLRCFGISDISELPPLPEEDEEKKSNNKNDEFEQTSL